MFAAQADALSGVSTLEGYTDWMKGLFTPMPDGRAELRRVRRRCGEQGSVVAYGVFRGYALGRGRAGAAERASRSRADYVYVMEFDGDRIRHMTKIWNDGIKFEAARLVTSARLSTLSDG